MIVTATKTQCSNVICENLLLRKLSLHRVNRPVCSFNHINRSEMSEKDEKTTSNIVGPLNFTSEEDSIETAPISLFKSPVEIQCLFCDKAFQFYSEKDDYLAHLYIEHWLIIGDEDQVAIFHEYLLFWREKFDGDVGKLSEYCTTMIMNQLPDGTPADVEKYYLLCDILPLDNELRQKLHKKRLEHALAQHQFERTDTEFKRNCLFCRDVINTTRRALLEHLFSKHFLQLGKPENLVFVDELIDMVQCKLNNLICLFCEKRFRDRPTFKEHMRKKGHKRINPINKSYDRFFLINYQKQMQNEHKKRSKFHKYNPNRNTEIRRATAKESSSDEQKRESSALDSDSDSNWSDWEGDTQVLTCLFCSRNEMEFGKLKQHMVNEHDVDFNKATACMTFYDRVKIVNFIRRKMYLLQCVECEMQFETSSALQIHMKEEKHCSFGDRKQWNLPEYLFPTYEDDGFLCSLDETELDDEDTKAEDSSIVVLSEDRKVSVNLDAEALRKEQFDEL